MFCKSCIIFVSALAFTLFKIKKLSLKIKNLKKKDKKKKAKLLVAIGIVSDVAVL